MNAAMRHFMKTVLTISAAALLAPATALAEGVGVAEYSDADVEALVAILDAVDSSGEIPYDPAAWDGITLSDNSIFAVNWEPENGEAPKRITGITLSGPAFAGALDASGLTELESLYCADSGITSVDVSGNPNLTTFDCSYSDVAALDLTANTKLAVLYCHETSLTKLDLSSNTELSALNCTGTSITSIDLRSNPRMTQAEFGPTSTLDVRAEGFSLKLSSEAGGSVSASLFQSDGALVLGASCRVPAGSVLACWEGAPSGADASAPYLELPATGAIEMSASLALDPATLLSSLEVEEADVSPAFRGDVFEYSTTVPYEIDSIDIRAAFEDVYGPHSSITGAGKHSLSVGENTIKVTLVAPTCFDPFAEDMVTREYTISIERQPQANVPSGEDGEKPESAVIAQTGDAAPTAPAALAATAGLFLLACSFMVSRRSLSA